MTAVALWRSGEQIGYQPGAADASNNLAAAHPALGDKRLALQSYTEALAVRRRIGDKRNEAAVLTNISAVQMALGYPRESLVAAEQALPLWRAIGDGAGEAQSLNAKAVALRVIGEPQEALLATTRCSTSRARMRTGVAKRSRCGTWRPPICRSGSSRAPYRSPRKPWGVSRGRRRAV